MLTPYEIPGSLAIGPTDVFVLNGCASVTRMPKSGGTGTLLFAPQEPTACAHASQVAMATNSTRVVVAYPTDPGVVVVSLPASGGIADTVAILPPLAPLEVQPNPAVVLAADDCNAYAAAGNTLYRIPLVAPGPDGKPGATATPIASGRQVVGVAATGNGVAWESLDIASGSASLVRLATQ